MHLIKKTTLAIVAIITLQSCGNNISKQPANAEGFTAIENEIKNEFGDNAYFTDLSISYDQSSGNMLSLTVTDAPETLKMGSYVFSQHTSWKQNSDVTLEVPQGTKASDFMFQLNDKINLTKLGELVEQAKEHLTVEKNIENPTLSMALIKYPKNGDISKMEYSINLKPENGGTSFTFYYTINGDFIKMDY